MGRFQIEHEMSKAASQGSKNARWYKVIRSQQRRRRVCRGHKFVVETKSGCRETKAKREGAETHGSRSSGTLVSVIDQVRRERMGESGPRLPLESWSGSTLCRSGRLLIGRDKKEDAEAEEEKVGHGCLTFNEARCEGFYTHNLRQ